MLGLLAIPAFSQPNGPARLAADLFPGTAPAYQSLSGFAGLGNRSVFIRVDNEYLALWATDGTPRGTSALGVFCPPCGGATLLGSNGRLAFYLVSESFPDRGLRIWRTDGTPAGTFPLTEGLKTPPGVPPFVSSLSGSRLFFTACTQEQGCEVWSSDGTVAGTVPVSEITPGPGDGAIQEIAAFGDRALLLAGPSPGERALWLADGAIRRVRKLKEAPEARNLKALPSGRAYFIAQASGLEMWSSDGTAAGTKPLTAFGPADPFGSPAFSRILGDRFYFTGNDGALGNELWSVEGGAAPRRLTDFGDPKATVFSLEKSGSRLVFVAVQRNGRKLWSSRGELASTGPVTGCGKGSCPTPRSPLGPVASGPLVFYGSDSRGDGFWRTDGTPGGTWLLRRPDRFHELVLAVSSGGRVLFEVTNEYQVGDLWVTDGTAAGTVLAAQGGPHWSHYYGWAGTLWGGSAGNRLVFPALTADRTLAATLWASDGTAQGSKPLFQSRTGASSNPSQLAALNGGALVQDCAPDGSVELRFLRDDVSTRLLTQRNGSCFPLGTVPLELGSRALLLTFGLDGVALWSTDGTPGGTVALVPAAGPDEPEEVTRFGAEAAFTRVVPGGGNQLLFQIWATNGTPGGTHKLVDLPSGIQPNLFTGLGGRLYFFDREGEGDDAVWRPWVSDGTPGGTLPLTAPLAPGGSKLSYTGLFLTEAGGRVFFPVAQGGGPVEIWSTEGTPAGTVPAITAASGMADPEGPVGTGDRLYFAAHREDDPSGPLYPWASDGTEGGTVRLAAVDLRRAPFPWLDPLRFVEVAGRVYFGASDAAHGEELWATDGTPAGTVLVKDLVPGPVGSYPHDLVGWKGEIWLKARDAGAGMELWRSDGTAAGTRLVQDIAPGASWSDPRELTPSGDTLYFSANDGVHGRELWRVP